MSKVYIGIDPGVAGAICIIRPGDIVDVWQHGKSKQEMLEIWQALLVGFEDKLIVALEDVLGVTGGSPMGKKSAFQLGNIVGFWEGLILSANIPYVMPRPQLWQKEIWKCGSIKDSKARKAFSRDEAIRVYPGLQTDLMRIKDHDKADAIHIARYAMLWDRKGRI